MLSVCFMFNTILFSLGLEPNIAAERIFLNLKDTRLFCSAWSPLSLAFASLHRCLGNTPNIVFFFFFFFSSTPYWAHYHSYNSPTASTACLQLTRNRLLSPPGPIKFGNLLSPPPGVPSLFPFSSSFSLFLLLQTSLCADRAVSQLCSVFFPPPLLLLFTIPPIHSP